MGVRETANGIPERGGVVNPCLSAFFGPGRRAFGQGRARVVNTQCPQPSQDERVKATRGRRTLPRGRLAPATSFRVRCEVVVGFAVDVEIDGSQGLPGIPPRRQGRMKPLSVSLWKSGGVVGPITYSTAPGVGGSCRSPARTKSVLFQAACSSVAGRTVRKWAWPSRRT
jgi:hypothetical protein